MTDLNAMYPSMSAPDSASQAAAATTAPEASPAQSGSTTATESHQDAQARLAAAMYPEAKPVPLTSVGDNPELTELRADPVRSMYSAQTTMREAIPQDALDDVAGYDAQVKASALAELRESAVDLGMEADDARQIFASARALEREPPTAETEAAWQREITQRLRETYGTEADARLADARKLVARDPRVAATFDTNRFGNHPATVLRIVELARSARVAGRFK